MGTWGMEAWENDGAADWFAQMHDKTNLAAYIEKTLSLDVTNYYEDIRAAASVLVALGREFTWPVEHLDRHLRLAASKLEEMLANDSCPINESEEIVSSVKRELGIIKTRM